MSGEMPSPPAGAPPFWTVDRVADALSAWFGNATRGLPLGPTPIGRVWTDTRTIRQGDCFVALSGGNFDAHDYLADAVAKGATALVVARPEKAAGLGVPVFTVPDTLVALGALARYRRRAWAKPIVGVVGSNGKTSTKELLRAALGAAYEVHATTGNFNNRVGVPLTLLAMPDSAELAVIEMGTSEPGEIAALREIVEPSAVVVTSIGEEHLEWLGNLEGVLREEISACVNAPFVATPAVQPEVAEAARLCAHRVLDVGLDEGELRPSSWSLDADGRGTLDIDGVTIQLPLRGVHNLRNAMLAVAVAKEAGVPMDAVGRGLAAMPVPEMRSNWTTIGRATLINDAYNASPASMRAAIELLAHAGQGKQRVAVLGTMRELGGESERLHEEVVGTALGAGLELVAGVGDFAAPLEAAGAGTRVLTAPDPDALWPLLMAKLEPDAVILLKGSRGVRLERIVPQIETWAAEHAAGTSHH